MVGIFFYFVREHIPLEQGLRLINFCCLDCVKSCQRAYSIRTRIKTLYSISQTGNIIPVREHIPLEQGLRQIFFACICSKANVVREHIPLEQGLRPFPW